MSKPYLELSGEFFGIQSSTKVNDKGENVITYYIELLCRSSKGAALVFRIVTKKPDLFKNQESRSFVSVPVNASVFNNKIYYYHAV